MINSESEEATIKYNHAFNNLTIIVSPKVLSALYRFAEIMIKHLKYNSVPNYEVQYTIEFTSLVKAMRSDLYGSKSDQVNRGLNEIYLL